MRISKLFNPLYFRLNGDRGYRYKVYHGGRGGGKSWEMAYALLLLGTQEKTRVLCAREVQNSIEDSVHKLLSDWINKDDSFRNFYYIFKNKIIGLNGSEFIFKGIAHDPMQIKSLEGIDICWIEEAQKVSKESWELLTPTIRKPNSEIWVSFNAHYETDITYKKFVTESMPNTFVKKVNWRDNPYFPETLEEERVYLKEVDQELYKHIWEGETKQSSNAQIFKGKYVYEDFSVRKLCREKNLPMPTFYFGLDWGFSNDPLAGLRCFELEQELYIDFECGGVEIELDDTGLFLDMLPNPNKEKIRADNARPESVSHVKKMSYPIVSCKKWSGCVEDGVEFIRTYRKIHIHTRCKRVKYEFDRYSYKEDKQTGEIMPVILDMDNHWMDALRYALETRIKGKSHLEVISLPDAMRR